jgi:plastocyanin
MAVRLLGAALLVLLGLTAGAGHAAISNVTVGPAGNLSYSPDPATIHVGDTVH